MASKTHSFLHHPWTPVNFFHSFTVHSWPTIVTTESFPCCPTIPQHPGIHEWFTSVQQPHPTFSPVIVHTPKHYRHESQHLMVPSPHVAAWDKVSTPNSTGISASANRHISRVTSMVPSPPIFPWYSHSRENNNGSPLLAPWNHQSSSSHLYELSPVRGWQMVQCSYLISKLSRPTIPISWKNSMSVVPSNCTVPPPVPLRQLVFQKSHPPSMMSLVSKSMIWFTRTPSDSSYHCKFPIPQMQLTVSHNGHNVISLADYHLLFFPATLEFVWPTSQKWTQQQPTSLSDLRLGSCVFISLSPMWPPEHHCTTPFGAKFQLTQWNNSQPGKPRANNILTCCQTKLQVVVKSHLEWCIVMQIVTKQSLDSYYMVMTNISK